MREDRRETSTVSAAALPSYSEAEGFGSACDDCRVCQLEGSGKRKRSRRVLWLRTHGSMRDILQRRDTASSITYKDDLDFLHSLKSCRKMLVLDLILRDRGQIKLPMIQVNTFDYLTIYSMLCPVKLPYGVLTDKHS